jgi:hypothetical protein
MENFQVRELTATTACIAFKAKVAGDGVSRNTKMALHVSRMKPSNKLSKLRQPTA